MRVYENLRAKKPLILCLTNVVTMDFVANCLLAVGAAPIMCQCEDEVEELVSLSSVIYINIGTLQTDFIRLCERAIEYAKKLHRLIVFDPVGAGASRIRTATARAIMMHASVVRGNASEIIALGQDIMASWGVEAIHDTHEAKDIARHLAEQLSATIVVSGAIDWVTNGELQTSIQYGSPLMQSVTGMGCSMSAVIAAFHAIIHDPFAASVSASEFFGVCGENAAKITQHPGSFKQHFIDQLHVSSSVLECAHEL